MEDCIVIGAGIAGLSSALALLQHGFRVTLLERGNVGQESSWAGGGILSPLCPWDYPDAATRLTMRGAALYPAWIQALHAATGIDPEYTVSGMLVLPPFDVEAAQRWCAEHGVRVESAQPPPALTRTPPPPAGEGLGERDRAEPFSLWGKGWEGGKQAHPPIALTSTQAQAAANAKTPPPSFPPPAGEGRQALLLPDVAQVRNPRLLRALRTRVEQLGGRIIEQCAVNSLLTIDARVTALATSCGEQSADCYIVTAGAWSKQVLGEHALQMDLKPVRGQMLLFKFDAPPLQHIVLQDGTYLIPRRDGHLLVGSTLEDAGFDKSTTQAAHAYLRQRAESLLPQLRGMPVVQHWAGLRPATPHNIPAIGRHPQLQNLYLNTGHFRYGVTMAPASAEILLNAITGASQPFDVSPYQAWSGAPR